MRSPIEAADKHQTALLFRSAAPALHRTSANSAKAESGTSSGRRLGAGYGRPFAGTVHSAPSARAARTSRTPPPGERVGRQTASVRSTTSLPRVIAQASNPREKETVRGDSTDCREQTIGEDTSRRKAGPSKGGASEPPRKRTTAIPCATRSGESRSLRRLRGLSSCLRPSKGGRARRSVGGMHGREARSQIPSIARSDVSRSTELRQRSEATPRALA